MKLTTKLWIGLIVLAIASPIGLYLPHKFKAGDAWGEWDGNKIKELVGYMPKGFEKIASLWNAIMPDYSFKGMEHASVKQSSGAYIISALIGMGLCFGVVFLISKFIIRKNRDQAHEKT